VGLVDYEGDLGEGEARLCGGGGGEVVDGDLLAVGSGPDGERGGLVVGGVGVGDLEEVAVGAFGEGDLADVLLFEQGILSNDLAQDGSGVVVLGLELIRIVAGSDLFVVQHSLVEFERDCDLHRAHFHYLGVLWSLLVVLDHGYELLVADLVVVGDEVDGVVAFDGGGVGRLVLEHFVLVVQDDLTVFEVGVVLEHHGVDGGRDSGLGDLWVGSLQG